jgi:hypothetical protein
MKECNSLGNGTAKEFVSKEFNSINLNDKRLDKRALTIYEYLQKNLTTCIRRLFADPKDARQAYDFF